jgi:hypothetical protein
MTDAEWGACTNPHVLLEALRGGSDRKLRLFACACVREIWPLLTGRHGRHLVGVAERFADGKATTGEMFAARNAEGDCRSRHVPWTVWRAARAAATATTSPAAWSAAVNAALASAKVHAAYAAHSAASEAPLHGAAAWEEALAQSDRLAALARLGASAGGTAVLTRELPEQVLNGLFSDPACGAAWAGARASAGKRQEQLLRDVFGNPFRPLLIHPDWLRWNGACVPRMAAVIYRERRFGDLGIVADALEDAGCDDADVLDHCRAPGPHVRGCWVVDALLGLI